MLYNHKDTIITMSHIDWASINCIFAPLNVNYINNHGASCACDTKMHDS